MAIDLDRLLRSGGLNMAPQQAPTPQAAPAAQAAPKGLLGGFFSPDGRDARQRLAIGLEGLTMRPNQAFIETLRGDLDRRATAKETAAQKNATVEWLRSRGRDDLAEAIAGGLPAVDALRMAVQPPDPAAALDLQIKQLQLEQMRNPQTDPMLALQIEKAQLELEQLRNPQADLTSTQREYDQAVRQGFKGTIMEYKSALAEAGRSQQNVSVGTGDGPTGALNKKLAEAEGTTLSTYLKQGPIASGAIQDLELLGSVLQYAPQDPITGRLAQLVPGVSSAGAAALSIIKRVAPTLRVEGSGATSDIEYNGMLQSLPSLVNYPEANNAILGMMKAKAAIDIQRAEIVREYANSAQKQDDAITMRNRLTDLDRQSIMTPEIRALIEATGRGTPAGGRMRYDQNGNPIQ